MQFLQKFDDISIVPTFILTPLTYLGGVFYSIEQLPSLWQFVSKFNPILYIINGFRYSLLGISDVDVSVAIIIILFLIFCLSYLNYIMLIRGVGTKS